MAGDHQGHQYQESSLFIEIMYGNHADRILILQKELKPEGKIINSEHKSEELKHLLERLEGPTAGWWLLQDRAIPHALINVKLLYPYSSVIFLSTPNISMTWITTLFLLRCN
jgi:hypothetical protein